VPQPDLKNEEVQIMKVKKSVVLWALGMFLAVFGSGNWAQAASTVSNADELVAQHLDSIAPAAVRAGLKNRVVQGPAEYRIMVGGAGVLDGKVQMASDGQKLIFMIKLPNNQYRGEQFIFNGDRDSVAFSGAQQTRSSLGNFVFVQDAVIREGLLGGALSTAWPLLDLKDRKAKLSFEGMKKVDGQDLYALKYHPRKNSDLDIYLYFDPQTFRHVETVYSYTTSEALAGARYPGSTGQPAQEPATASLNGAPIGSPGGTGSPETASARQVPNRYRLTEKFSDFKTVDGVTLPTHEDIQFDQELQNGRTSLWDYDLKGLEIANNMGVDAKNFDVK
jgi:hypothetical protein